MDDAEAIVSTDIFESMDIFPHDDSVKTINGVLTIKLSDFK